MKELREFIYLDNTSLNSHLSSLGKALPSEMVRSTEGETEKGGHAGGGVLGAKLGGKYTDIDRDAVETTMTVTSPYRFQDFLDTLEEEGIDIYENPDPRSVDRGDLVRIEGHARPMALFKYEMAVKTIRMLANQETQSSLQNLEGDSFDPVQLQQLKSFEKAIEQFIGGGIPLRFDSGEHLYGTALDREMMRTDPISTFLDEPQFKMIGRVKQRILGNETWDPVLATDLTDRYLPNESSDEVREQLEPDEEDININTTDEDWKLEEQTASIHPIAVFW